MPQGKALDIVQGSAIEGYDAVVSGSNDYADIEGADVVIVTAGIPRKPGMSRDDLIGINAKIVTTVGAAIKKHCPQAFVITITNPLDVMVWVMREACGLPPQRVVGMAGVLDSARFRYFLAEEFGVSVEDVTRLRARRPRRHDGAAGALFDRRRHPVAGSRQDGVDDAGAARQDRPAHPRRRRRDRRAVEDRLGLLRAGQLGDPMAEAYLRDKKRVLPCAAWLDGQYGVKDLYVGVPVVIGAGGVERIVEISLDPEEKAAFDKSVAAVRELIEVVKDMKMLAA